MGSNWWWSLDDYRLIIRLSFNRHPMIIAQTCVISWLNRRPIVGSWRSGWRLSGNPGSPANPGNLWKPCFRTPWDPTQILRPPCFRPDICKCCLNALVISQKQSSFATPKHSQVQTSASAIIVWKYFACGRTLTNRMTNAHPESQHKSFVPKVIYDFRSLHEICGFATFCTFH